MLDNGNPPTIQELFALITNLQADNENMKEELKQLREKRSDDHVNDDDPLTGMARKTITMLITMMMITLMEQPKGVTNLCSISSFQELADQFINHFATSAIYKHNSDYLSTIKQGQHESLRDYMTRFTKTAMEIPDLNADVHLHALKSDLRPGKF
ncbi:hypothetical protein PIB30_050931 [Stylosanthes scabra]|uniref:Retrotransposon gag domain-containing protein n=1 Tax=Stylosanthes scabra TaxID=79078 RepID=A0ABU6RHT3_9FABA|nr:hypothetical protein [Stylosanthes scabra]